MRARRTNAVAASAPENGNRTACTERVVVETGRAKHRHATRRRARRRRQPHGCGSVPCGRSWGGRGSGGRVLRRKDTTGRGRRTGRLLGISRHRGGAREEKRKDGAPQLASERLNGRRVAHRLKRAVPNFQRDGLRDLATRLEARALGETLLELRMVDRQHNRTELEGSISACAPLVDGVVSSVVPPSW